MISLLPTRASRRILRASAAAISFLLPFLFLTAAAPGQAGQTLSVADGDVAGLISAIQTLNAGGGGTINLSSGGMYSVTAPSDWWYGPNAFPAIASSITINGNGATISRASGSPKFRFFYVSGGFSTLPGGSLLLENITLTGGLAQGGSGGGGLEGGGGGAGFGGAIYNQGILSLSQVSLTSNTAQGGAGASPIGGQTSGGGGGGMGGNGGTSQGFIAFGGGGGGFKTDGAGSTNENAKAGGVGGSFLGSEGGGDCAAGGTSTYGGQGGNAEDENELGGGGGGGFMPGENGGNAYLTGTYGVNVTANGGAGAVGGGTGGSATGNYGNNECGGSGGAFGGGGAGASNAGLSGGGGGGGVGGGGGAGGGAGNGGFGGGGGGNGGGQDGEGGGFVGGNGGFGGGGGGVGGGGATPAGQGGFGGGAGTQQDSLGHNYGGGGAGFGGAIFNHIGSVYAVSSTFTGNSAIGGIGAVYGDAFGGVLFNLNGTVSINAATYSGDTATKNGVADAGNFAYNMSSNDGNTAAGQSPVATMAVVNTTIASPTGDFQNNPYNGTATLDLDASGPLAEVTPGWLNFGSQPVGSTSLPQPVTVTNIGNAPLSISGISPSSGVVMASNGCGATLAAGISCTVYVSIMPGSATNFTGSLTFTDNSASTGTQTVTLNATGVTQAAASQLVFPNGLPSTSWPGQAALVDVLEETSSGVQQYAATDTITLTITGPNSYSKTYTTAAVNGMATFNLLGGLPSVAGTYSFVATATGLSTAMNGTNVVVPTVGTSAGYTAATVNFAVGGVLNSILVTTSGTLNSDFTHFGGGSCSIGTLYSAGQSCVVAVNLIPQATGTRTGGVILLDPNGNTLGTSYISAYVSGAQIAFPGVAQQIPGSFSYPSAVSIDGSGDVFTAGLGQYAIGAGSEQITESKPSAGNYSTSTLSGLQSTWGAALDGAGNLFITFAPAAENGAVIEYPWNGQSFGTGINIASGISGYWSSPTNLTVDAAGNLYVIDGLLVEKLPWTGVGYGPGIQIAPGAYWQPVGIAVDSQGNVYIADSFNDQVDMIPWNNLGTTSPTPINGTFNSVNNVALDGNGNLYTADEGNGAISRFANVGGGNFGAQTTVMSGLSEPEGLATDAQGNLYVTAAYSNQVWKVNYSTPPTLSFPTLTRSGTTDTADGPRTTTLTNVGNQPLQFSTPGSGSNPSYPANFPVNTGDASLCAPSTPIAVGASCDISANFAPTGFGANSGSIVLTDNAIGGTQSIAVSGTAATPGMMTSPASGSTLTSASVTFSWSAGTGVSQYLLHVGTAGVGSNNIASTAALTTTSYSVSGIPTNGGTLYVRLYSYIAGAWQSVDYTYTELHLATPATMSTPAPGSTLTGSTAAFTWTAGAGVTQYLLHVGTTGTGSNNIASTPAQTTLTYTVTGIPTSGGTLNVRLYSLIDGAWQFNDYTYTEVHLATPAAMSTPAPGSTLTGASAGFTWTAGAGVSQYLLHVGTTGAGSSNIDNTGSLQTTSTTITGIPTTGGTLNVRLYSLIAGAWQYNDYTYTEANLAARAVMSTPAPGSTLTGSSATFTWTAGTGVTQYLLHVGTTGAGSNNVASTPSQTALTYTVSGIPTSGATLYVRLYSYIAGAWQYNDYTYTEHVPPVPATMTAPAAGSTVTGSSATFTWTAGTGVSQYLLHVGTTGVGSNNIASTPSQTALTCTVSGIPTTGGTLYVRLYSYIAGAWQYNDYTYTEQ